jgi:hypothetical protein
MKVSCSTSVAGGAIMAPVFAAKLTCHVDGKMMRRTISGLKTILPRDLVATDANAKV